MPLEGILCGKEETVPTWFLGKRPGTRQLINGVREREREREREKKKEREREKKREREKEREKKDWKNH